MNPLNLIPQPYRLWVIIALVAAWSGACAYSGWWVRDTAAKRREADLIADAAKLRQTQDVRLATINENLGAQINENRSNRPRVTVTAGGMCQQPTAAGPGTVPEQHAVVAVDDDAAARSEATAIGEAFDEDAHNYADCYAALQAARASVKATRQ